MLKTPFSYRFIFQDVFPQFQAGALGNLEAFTSFNGPDFYGLRPRLVACGIGVARFSLALERTVAFCFYLIIIV